MKGTCLFAAMAAGTLLCACAALPPPETPKTRVSADYEAAGDVSGISAFIYGKRTVLEFSGRPLWLTVQDENGVAVPYEREGRYYRLSRQLERFTVRVNARLAVFNATFRPASVIANRGAASADPAPLAVRTEDAAPTIMSPVTVSAELAPEDDIAALLRLSAAQQEDVRRAISRVASTVEAKALNARLDRVKARFNIGASVVIRVQFDTGATEFTAEDRFARALLAAARTAERINVRGRTDARIPGKDDPRIALGRATSARRFLVEQGVDAAKIHVFSLPAGDFVAPAGTDEGRALNRRVEIELIDRRYAALTQQPETLQGTTP